MKEWWFQIFNFQSVNATSKEKYMTTEKPFTTRQMALETVSQLSVEQMEP